jgi:hypothetical protein
MFAYRALPCHDQTALILVVHNAAVQSVGSECRMSEEASRLLRVDISRAWSAIISFSSTTNLLGNAAWGLVLRPLQRIRVRDSGNSSYLEMTYSRLSRATETDKNYTAIGRRNRVLGPSGLPISISFS